MPNYKIFRGSHQQLADSLRAERGGSRKFPDLLLEPADIHHDLYSSYFMPTDFNTKDLVHTCLDPNLFKSYTSGLIDANCLEKISDRDDHLQILREECCAFSYVDDAGIPCGVYIMKARNSSYFLYGLIRNTGAPPNERQILIIGSESLLPFTNSASSFFNQDGCLEFLASLNSASLRTLFQNNVFAEDGSVKDLEVLKSKRIQLNTEDKEYMTYMEEEIGKAKYWPFLLAGGLIFTTAAILSVYCFAPIVASIAVVVCALLAISCFLNTILMLGTLRTSKAQLELKVEALHKHSIFVKNTEDSPILIEQTQASNYYVEPKQ